ncbi:phage tail length tape measure family protein [Aureimonas altamirensis]|uniref:phage tail length tape measure family protein n=1 Tax=Aureimonas altamirensis TaxID=370622 RepID=UPI00301B6860
MADKNRVSTATFRAKEEGVDDVARKLGGLAKAAAGAEGATEGLAKSTETSSKRLGSITRELDRLEKTLAGSPSAWNSFERGASTASRALEAGKIDAQEYARILTDLQTRLQKSVAPRLGLDVNQSGVARILENTKQVSAATRMATRDILNQAVAAQEASDKQARANEAVAGQVARIRAEIDPLGVAQSRLNAELAEYNTLAAAGHLSTSELAAATNQANTRFMNTAARLGQVSSEVKLTSFQMTNLGYQVNDIGTMLAMGASPFQIMASQAGQVYQALGDGPGGVRGSLNAIKVATIGFIASLGPAGAAVAAVGTAAAAAWYLTRDSQKPVNDLIEQQEKLLRNVQAAYGETGQAAQQYGRQSKAVMAANVNDQIADASRRLQEMREGLNADLFSGLSNRRNRVYLERGGDENFSAAIADFRSATPDLARVQELLLKVEQSDAPEHIRDVARAMREALDPMRELQGSTQALAMATSDFARSSRAARAAFEEQRQALAGYVRDTRTAVQQIEDEYSRLMRIARTEADVRAADELRSAALAPIRNEAQAQAEEEAFRRSLIGLDAETKAIRENNRAYAERLKAVEGDTAATQSLIAARDAANSAVREEAAFDRSEKAREEAKAYEDATRARLQGIQDTVRSMAVEQATIGMSEGAAAAYRFEVEALASAKRAAAEAGGVVSADEIATIEAAAASIRLLTEQTNALREAEAQRKRVRETIDDLEFQTAISGLSEVDRQIATTLRNVGVTAESVDGQRIAGSIRVRDQIDRQNAALDQQRDVLENVASTFLDIFDTSSADSFFDRIMSGLADIGRQFAEIGKQKLMENLFGAGVSYTAGAPYPGQRSTAPAGFPAGYGQGSAYGVEPRSLVALNDNLQRSARSALDVAKQFDGLNERADTGTLDNFLMASGQWKGLSAQDTAWCASFANAAIARAGGVGSCSNLASSFMDWGTGTTAPKVGDIVVLKPQSRGASGHVGFVAGFGDGTVQVFGGNQSNGANTKSFGVDQVRGYRTDASLIRSATSDGYVDAYKRLSTGQAGAVDRYGIPTSGGSVAAGFDPFTGYSSSGGGFSLGGGQGGLFGPRGQAGLQVGAAALGAFGSGYQSGSPLSGGIGGAFSGYGAAGSISSALGIGMGAATGIGIVGGAALGILGGILGARKEREQKHREAAAKWAEMQPEYNAFKDTLDGYAPNSGLRSEQGRLRSEMDKFVTVGSAAWKYGKGNSSAEFANTAAMIGEYVERMNQSFRDAFGATTQELRGGLGFDGPFLKARDAVRQLDVRIDTFIDDTVVAFGDHAPQIREAQQAAADYALSTIAGTDGLSDMSQKLQELHGRANALSPVLTKLGFTATAAADAVSDALTAGIARLRDEFTTNLQADINSAGDKGYLNSIRDLVEQRSQMLGDAEALGADPALVARWFQSQVQSVVDGTDLIGDELQDLVQKFPELAGVITASMSALERAVSDAEGDLRTSYNERKSELEQLADRMTRFGDAVAEFRKSLALDDRLSNLSPFERFTEAQEDFRKVAELAAAGDEEAQEKLLNVSRDYLDQARSYYASSEQYYAAFDEVGGILASTEAYAKAEQDIAKAQLEALDLQIGALIDIDDSVKSVADAIAAFNEAQAARDNAQAIALQGYVAAINPAAAAAPGYQAPQIPAPTPTPTPAAPTEQKAYANYRTASGATVRYEGVRKTVNGVSIVVPTGMSDSQAWMLYARTQQWNNRNDMPGGRQMGGLIPGFEVGGVVGNGIYDRDSVVARYAGGGAIALAGGEMVVRARHVTPETYPVLDAINRTGRVPGSDAALIAEVRSLRAELRSIRQTVAMGAGETVAAVREGNEVAREQASTAKRKAAA